MSRHHPPDTRASVALRSLSDAEILRQVIFPVLARRRVSKADYGLGLVVDQLRQRDSIPITLVLWPTGVKAMLTITPGDTSPDACGQLIRVYRAAEAGRLGPTGEEFHG